MNFQDRTQGVGVPCVLLPSWPPPPSPRSLSAGAGRGGGVTSVFAVLRG